MDDDAHSRNPRASSILPSSGPVVSEPATKFFEFASRPEPSIWVPKLVVPIFTEAEQVKLDKTINECLWEKGCEKPPLSIRVRAVKFADGEVQAELAQ